MGTVLLKRSYTSSHGPLMTDIRDQFGYGIDVYPKNLTPGHTMLEDYAQSRKLYPKKKKAKMPEDKHRDKLKDKKSNEESTGMMHIQEELVPGTSGKTHASIKCHNCEKFGHCASHCPDDNGNKI